MNRVILFALLGIASYAPVGTAQENWIDSQALRQAGLRTYWQLRVPLQAGEQVTDAYLVDETIYLGSDRGFVFALDAGTGVLRWTQQFTRGAYRLRRPCHIGVRTVIVTPPEVIQFDRHFGSPIRLQQLRFPAGTGPVSDGRLVFIGGLDRRIYAFQPDRDFETWKAGADAQVISTPAIHGQYLYYASDGRAVYACRAADKRLYWIARTVGAVVADLVVTDEGVFVASQDRSLYLLDPAFGGRRWRVRLSSPLSDAPVVTPETAYQYSARDGLVAIESGGVQIENRVRWTFPRGRSLLTVDQKHAYALTQDQHIAVLRKDTGEVVHNIAAPGLTMPLPHVEQMVLYAAASDGRVICVRSHDVPPLQPEEVQQALALRPESEAGPETSEVETEPAPEAATVLESTDRGPPVGGKSKISREWTGGGG
jgi:hypothetical protein